MFLTCINNLLYSIVHVMLIVVVLIVQHFLGLDDEYLYRKPGMFLKAAKLVKDALERGKINSIDLTDEFEWDTETLASAIKNYFGKHLGEPLLTFNLHERFIEAASELNDFYLQDLG